jgi:hypothetical protein
MDQYDKSYEYQERSFFEIEYDEVKAPFHKKATLITCHIVSVASVLFIVALLSIPFKAIVREIRGSDDTNLFLFGVSKPNILFILTDDQGINDMVRNIRWFMLVYSVLSTADSSTFQDIPGSDMEGLMPNIRSLNYAGLNFTNYYTPQVCTPSRAALMTGNSTPVLICCFLQSVSITLRIIATTSLLIPNIIIRSIWY